VLCGGSIALASPYLPPIVDLVLQKNDAQNLSHLERVLAAYENPDSSHIFVAAHRGGRETDVADNAPGNSIANIDVAGSKGFDLYESDIEILGDGTLIVFHDDTFDNLTNTSITDDTLGEADIEYAKSLFLTFVNGTSSNEVIPTLEEFLLAGKDKIMFKFDLKSGTFGGDVLRRIFDTIVSTETEQQVLIRGGANVLTTAAEGGYDTNIIMRRYNSEPSVDEINTLVNNYSVRAISIPDGANDDVINTANAAGLVVEVHELQGDDIPETERQDKIDQGVRQFHSFQPDALKDYLDANNHREF